MKLLSTNQLFTSYKILLHMFQTPTPPRNSSSSLLFTAEDDKSERSRTSRKKVKKRSPWRFRAGIRKTGQSKRKSKKSAAQALTPGGKKPAQKSTSNQVGWSAPVVKSKVKTVHVVVRRKQLTDNQFASRQSPVSVNPYYMSSRSQIEIVAASLTPSISVTAHKTPADTKSPGSPHHHLHARRRKGPKGTHAHTTTQFSSRQS